jgi:two-component system sensor histidine kinase MprB
VRRLTETAERVSETGDLSERIEVEGRDELSRLAGSFNAMLAALEDSTRAQRQLVADASHELRTPLTSLRTNIEVLASDRALPAEERGRLLSDVVEQLGEMTTLIAELIELARAEEQTLQPEDVRLDLLAADAVERARRNRPGVTFTTDLEESVVHGVPGTIERAISNLLDNAAKWTRPGRRSTSRCATAASRCATTGRESPTRTFRTSSIASTARARRGHARLRPRPRDRQQVAEAHGGEVVAERADGGGTRVVLRFGRAPVQRRALVGRRMLSSLLRAS